MPRAPHPNGSEVRILEVDPDLATGIGPDDLPDVADAAVARAYTLDRGEWTPPRTGPNGHATVGLLVLDGLLLRSVEIRDRSATELLADGDLLRPWQDDAEAGPLPVSVRWRVLQPTTVAVLDGRFAASVAAWPQINAALVGRALRRARWQGVLGALSHMNRVDERVLLAFWCFAERWGRVRPDGVLVRLPLTHEQLGALVGARRPTVTTSLSTLAERGALVPVARGEWLLTRPARKRAERLRAARNAGSEAPALAA